jgi:hypothetical protein
MVVLAKLFPRCRKRNKNAEKYFLEKCKPLMILLGFAYKVREKEKKRVFNTLA